MPPRLTPSPTVVDDCSFIANGQPLEDQDSMATQEYDILLDVSLDSTQSLAPITLELTRQQIQRVIIPSLAGCSEVEVRRLQRTSSGITNGLAQAQHDRDRKCMEESSSPCYGFKISLYLYVQELVKFADFTDMIIANFQQAPLVQRLELSVPPFVNINIVASFTPTPTSNPSVSLPQRPTFAPVAFPTTSRPTSTPNELSSTAPTNTPTLVPLAMPTAQPAVGSTPLPTSGATQPPTPGPTLPPGPTAQPILMLTPRPTLPPTPGPTLPPTPGPTQTPTPGPTQAPITASPTKSPTPLPSPSPTIQPSSLPSTSPSLSKSPTYAPTNRPCFQNFSDLYNAGQNWRNPTILGTYGPVSGWCFGPGVTSMQGLFRGQSSFNEDISGWDVSRITDMKEMFSGATSFNRNIGNWDVSSVTNMEWMFFDASAFNKDLSNWDVSSVTQMGWMFQHATAFRQNLCPWNQRTPITNSYYVGGMFYNSACPSTSEPDLSASPRGPFCYVC